MLSRAPGKEDGEAGWAEGEVEMRCIPGVSEEPLGNFRAGMAPESCVKETEPLHPPPSTNQWSQAEEVASGKVMPGEEPAE